MKMLVGDDFEEGIRRYVTKFKYGYTKWEFAPKASIIQTI
jgi:hypothetical protein